MNTTLAIEYGYGRATHAGPQGTLVGMLLGTVMAMMGSMALDGTQVLPKIRTAVFFPVAIGTGMVIGVSVAGHTDAMLAVFVAVVFVAVFIRRFGLPYFFYGFMMWMGCFFGRELSEARCFRAVIAAFIAFTGTATRSETFIKATNRVVGTLLGLGAGIGLAHLTAGHTLWVIAVIVLSMSCGFYPVSLSYAAMIFFVTIMVSQLCTQLHEFSAGLLMLRLEETAIGAAIGIAVALVVLPTSARDTVSSARGSYFAALGELLDATAARLEHDGRADRADGATSPDGVDLDALVRVVDHRLQQLALVARPLTRPLVWGNDPRLVRHRLTLYAAVTRQTRALALAPAPQGRPAAEVARALRAADAALLTRLPAAGTVLPPVTRPLLRPRQLLHELAVLPPGHVVGGGFTGRGAGSADASRIVTGSHAAGPVRDRPHGVTTGAAGERPGPGDDLPHASGAAGDGAPRRL
ncbi:FUSC family protein [Streptomyces sp. NPDC008139]|uniref:FUSC family protein n=1 Tax=Streptomyces sp. NPDC008139 TaxID=3364814 RepID=UPI0036E9E977